MQPVNQRFRLQKIFVSIAKRVTSLVLPEYKEKRKRMQTITNSYPRSWDVAAILVSKKAHQYFENLTQTNKRRKSRKEN